MSTGTSHQSEFERLPPMSHYVLGLLWRVPTAPKRTSAEADALQEAHMGHLRRLREAGHLLALGPLEDSPDLRGVMVFQTDSPDAARKLMETDPLVGGGFLKLDLYRWFAPATLRTTSQSAPE